MNEKFYHRTKDGERILLEDITDEHLDLIIKMHKRRAETGMTVHTGAMGDNGIPLYADQDELYGDECLEELNTYIYIAEQLRRKVLKDTIFSFARWLINRSEVILLGDNNHSDIVKLCHEYIEVELRSNEI